VIVSILPISGRVLDLPDDEAVSGALAADQWASRHL
jgi:hypothetical protein